MIHRPPVPDNDGNLPPESTQLAAFDHALIVAALLGPLVSTMISSVSEICSRKLETDKDCDIVEIRIVNGVFTYRMEARRKIILW